MISPLRSLIALMAFSVVLQSIILILIIVTIAGMILFQMFNETFCDNLYQGLPDFFSDGPNFIKILCCGPQNFYPLFFLHKNHIIDVNVNFGYFIHKCIINSLVVHPKFDTGAAENLWRATLWPPLIYMFASSMYCKDIEI